MRRFFLLLVIAGSFSSIASAATLQDDLRQRRSRFTERLGADSMLIMWSAPERVWSNDVDYEYRQDSNFYYLTGIDQPQSILVLKPGDPDQKEVLFVLPHDATREHWEGHRLSPAEATAVSGIGVIHVTTEFQAFLDSVLSRDAKTQIAVVGPPPRQNGKQPESYEFVNNLRAKFPGLQMRDVTTIFRDLRQVKTEYERALLEENGRMSGEAHKAGMKAAHPGAYEYEVEAAIEYVFKKSSGSDWAYPSIVASGPNATILHYEKSTRRMNDGELLLVDAGAEYKYMSIDITRTYPVNGKFTDAQKDIYTIVLRAQDEGMKVAKAGARLRDIHQKTVEVIKDGLLKLGLITDASGNQYQTWYTHNADHFIGIDVHDVGDASRPLADGMAFTIEPGIYIQPDALDNLPKTPENQAFIEKVRTAFEKYKSIGVRIEDSFLLDGGKLKQLSAGVPRTVEDIETFMKSR